ncbi:hypothetical protein JX265_012942 [Neoarthrinium moseri]|uniref:NACHT domain-containing protein n=1 Tax=Neoarthrinium moseri TaxID=1658444 RepID=A0A9P9W9B7_9PEZI|nr:hypothetical protein JX265_012942 [Neoarthrinium moseri]
MSFGFSIGDFLAAIKLANQLRKDFAGAPDQFQHISSELRSLSFTLQDVDIFLYERDITELQQNKLREISTSCCSLMQDIQRTLAKYSILKSAEVGVRKRVKRAWQRVQWEPDDIHELRTRITSNIVLLNSLLSSYTRDVVAKLAERQTRQEHQELLDWLTLTDFTTQQADLIRQRHPETLQWLLTSAEYVNWITAHGDALFCHGIPGTGKTMLSSIVVDNLKERFKSDKAVGICYFYCNYRRHDEQQLDNFILSFLRQLVQCQSTISEELQELRSQHQSDRTRPTLKKLTAVLQKVVETFSKVFIVVDAMDECQTSDDCRNLLISELRRLQASVKVNLLVTSRPVPHIVTGFRDCTSIEVRASEEDIGRYTNSYLQRLPGFVMRNPDLQKEIKSKIVETVDGMFLLAQLSLASLEGKRSPKALVRMLANLARGADAYDVAYKNALERICGQGRDREELALQVLMWISCAKRPLTTTELRHALAVEVGEPEFSEDNIPDLEDTVSACCGLVVVDRETDIIRLVHYTTQAFFDREGTRWFPNASRELGKTCVTYLSYNYFNTGACSTNEDLGHRLAQFPLYDYSSKHWGTHIHDYADDDFFLQFMRKKTHLQAAAQAMKSNEWSMSRNPKDAPRSTTELHLAAYFGLRNMIEDTVSGDILESEDSDYCTPLIYAARYGHIEIVQVLLDKGANLNSKNLWGSTALSEAVGKRNEAVVKILLEEGADVNIQDVLGETPLSKTAGSGDESMVQLLLGKKSNVIYPENGYVAVASAIKNGYDSIVRLLLEGLGGNHTAMDYGHLLVHASELGSQSWVEAFLANGADVDTKDKYGRRPLHLAARRGFEAIVRILLDNGAQVNAKDDRGMAPLHTAVRDGKESVLLLLLTNGADVDAQDNHEETPLLSAVEHGHEATVRILLENKATADMQDKDGRTPLTQASKSGNKAIVQMLIDHGADIDIMDNYGWTPLSRAISSRHESIVQILLDKGATAEARGRDKQRLAEALSERQAEFRMQQEAIDQGYDDDGYDMCLEDYEYSQAPLAWAVEEGFESIVQALLDRNADVEAMNKYSHSPLVQATMQHRGDIVKMLLERGADVNAEDEYGHTTLYNAVSANDEDIVRMLLMSNADVNAKVWDGSSPLFEASENGYHGIVELLLGHGAEVNAKDDYDSTPLSLAVENGHEAAVRLLLSSNADAKAINKHGRSHLSQAIGGGHMNIAQMLLQSGAEANALDENDVTPLFYAITSGSEAAVRFLLENGVEVDFLLPNKLSSPLVYAAWAGKETIAQLLLERGAKVDLANKLGETPLIRAARRGHTAVVHLLLDMGANLGLKDYLGRSALFHATMGGQREAVALLTAGSNTYANHCDHYGTSVVSVAARFGHEDILRDLVSLGDADLVSSDCFGRDAIWWASVQGNERIRQHLTQVARCQQRAKAAELKSGTTLSFGQKRRSCDVCLADIAEKEQYVACEDCGRGDFYICIRCQDLGARCRGESHVLKQCAGGLPVT